MDEPTANIPVADQLLTLARHAYKKRRFPEVIDRSQAALALDPTLEEAYLLSSLAYGELGRVNEAENLLQHLLALDDNSAAGHGLLGAIRVSRAEYEKAIRSLNRSITLNARAWQPHFNLGIALAQAGQSRQAVREYATAFRRRPSWRILREVLIESLHAQPAMCWLGLIGLVFLPLVVPAPATLTIALGIVTGLGVLAFSSEGPGDARRRWAYLAVLAVIAAIDLYVASTRM